MANVQIPQLPLAITLTGNEEIELASPTGNPSAPFVSQYTTTGAIADLFVNEIPAAVEFITGTTFGTLPAGLQQGYMPVPFSGVITSASLLSHTPNGSVSVDIWKCSYTNFDGGVTHPLVGDSITAGNYLIISSGTKYLDPNLTGWTTTVNQGDILAFYLNSVSNMNVLTISLDISRNL